MDLKLNTESPLAVLFKDSNAIAPWNYFDSAFFNVYFISIFNIFERTKNLTKMKKLLFTLPILLLIACAQQEKASEPTNGFGPYDGQSVYLGDQATVEAFKNLDLAWGARD